MAGSYRSPLPKPVRTDQEATKAYIIEGMEPHGLPLRRNTAWPLGRKISKRNRRSR